MFSRGRRRFFGQAGAAGLAFATGGLGERLAFAHAPQAASGPARIYIDPAQRIARLDPFVLGGFIEHLGRAIYGGLYEPGSKLSDSRGFRKDVLEVFRKMRVPVIRYPGGNFVSGYNWLHGVGPKEKRPKILDRAWNTLDSNQFGTNEFVEWCRDVKTEPMLAVNLGTGTPETAVALVEYCNVEKGTYWSNLRREHGIEKPHNVKWWCLGNEMDGPWQIGHMPAREYGRKARDAARQMRVITPDLELIACGSSNNRMPTYPDWDRETLEECYDQVDGLSLHRYYGNDRETGGDTAKYLAMNLDMDIQIKETAGVCDYVRALKRSRKTLWLSFDEWNVWYRARGGEHADGKRQEAPKLLEEIYNLEDALLVGGLLNTLVRNCDRVRVACLAQLINVIGPVFTNPEGLFLQTIYYPYVWMLHHARGEALRLAVESATYDIDGFGPSPFFEGGPRGRRPVPVPYLDAAATRDPATGEVALFILNRDLNKAREVELVWRESPPKRVAVSQTLTGSDLKAVNSFEKPNNVAPQEFKAPAVGDRMKLELPPRSYTVLHFTNA